MTAAATHELCTAQPQNARTIPGGRSTWVVQGLFPEWISSTPRMRVVVWTYYLLMSSLWLWFWGGWLGGVVVSVSDSRSRGPGFDSRPVHCQATTLGKLLTPMCLCHQAVQFGTGQRAVMLCDREGNCKVWRRTGHAAQTLVLSPPTGSRPR